MTHQFFERHIAPLQHKLYRLALSITGNAHDAEDVVQEVLEKIWKIGEQPINNWEAWCMTLTRHRAIDRQRAKASSRVNPIDALKERTDASARADSLAETGDLVEQARRLMRQLPEKQRLTMHLRDVEEMTYDEIAQTLDLSLDQVKINLHRARKAIREQLIHLLSIQKQAS